MTLVEIVQTASQYGLPLVALIFLVYKGIPRMIKYVDEKTKEHEERVDAMVEKHETRMEALVNDYKEHTNRTNDELNFIRSQLPQVQTLKEQNESIKSMLAHTTELIERLNEKH